MKLHPDFDDAISGILQKSPKSFLIFVNDDTPRHRAWRKKLLLRLSKSSNGFLSAGILQKRVIFLQRLTPLEFMALMRRATIVLDVYPFGGGVTTLESFAMCAPVITAPALQTVPQLASGMYKHMNISISPVVWGGTEEYINKSVELLENREMHQALVSDICANRHKLFNQQSTVDEWASFLQRVFQQT